MKLALDIENLSKRFGNTVAVDNLSLQIPTGELHALLGPNGAGKTTTLRIVAGLLRADAGRVSILGHDIAGDPIGAKRVLGFLPDDPLLYDKLTALEYLEFVAGLWQVDPDEAVSKADGLLQWLDLSSRQNERIEGFSRGMRQKLALAGALIHDPEVLILDEPLTGLDASTARQVKDLLVARARSGKSVILTTHILEVAERLAARISIIDRGRVVADGSLEELRGQAHQSGVATLEDVFLKLTSEAGETTGAQQTPKAQD
jgi:ABC-2 type transport system ATP-binding protein